MYKWKITTVITCLLVLVVLAAACGVDENAATPPSPSISLVTYENTEHGFSIGHPAGWTENVTITDGDTVYEFKEAGGRLTAEVDVGYSTADFVLADFVARYKPYMESLNEYESISQGNVVIGGGISGYEMVFKAEVTAGKPEEIRYIFFVNGKQRFVVGCRGDVAYFDQQKDLVEAIIRSFKLLATYTHVPTVANPGGTYTNNQYGFSVTYPDGWKATEGGQHGGVVELVFDGLMPIITVGVSSVDKGTTLAEFVLQSIPGTINIWGGYQLVSLDKITLNDGTPAYAMVISGAMQGTKIKAKYIALIKGTKAAIITGFDIPGQFEVNETIMDEVILSFHLE